jgi:hypothetical protein
LALLSFANTARMTLDLFDIPFDKLCKELELQIPRSRDRGDDVSISPATNEAFHEAELEARLIRSATIGPEQMLTAIAKVDCPAARLLMEYGYEIALGRLISRRIKDPGRKRSDKPKRSKVDLFDLLHQDYAAEFLLTMMLADPDSAAFRAISGLGVEPGKVVVEIHRHLPSSAKVTIDTLLENAAVHAPVRSSSDLLLAVADLRVGAASSALKAVGATSPRLLELRGESR